MKSGPNIAVVSALIGDPARANILTALLAGKAQSWSRPSGQFGGLDKLGSGCRQAANLCILLSPYASSGVRPARAEWGRRAL